MVIKKGVSYPPNGKKTKPVDGKKEESPCLKSQKGGK